MSTKMFDFVSVSKVWLQGGAMDFVQQKGKVCVVGILLEDRRREWMVKMILYGFFRESRVLYNEIAHKKALKHSKRRKLSVR